MSLPNKNMSPKKGYMKMGGREDFYLGAHIKCAGTVAFILLKEIVKLSGIYCFQDPRKYLRRRVL